VPPEASAGDGVARTMCRLLAYLGEPVLIAGASSIARLVLHAREERVEQGLSRQDSRECKRVVSGFGMAHALRRYTEQWYWMLMQIS
jgi:hypothetical protein